MPFAALNLPPIPTDNIDALVHVARRVLTEEVGTPTLPTDDINDHLPTLQDSLGQRFSSPPAAASSPSVRSHTLLSIESNFESADTMVTTSVDRGKIHKRPLDVACPRSSLPATVSASDWASSPTERISRPPKAASLGQEISNAEGIVHDDGTGDNHLEEDSSELIPDFEDLLEEAHDFWGGGKPDFCVNGGRDRTRTVRLEDSSIAGLNFSPWVNSERYGYWWLLDLEGNKRIVKYMKGHYHAWLGLVYGLAEDTIAHPVITETDAKESEAKSPVVDHQDSPVRSFRTRTLKQERPYGVYNVKRQSEKKGIALTDQEIEQALSTPGRKGVATKSHASSKKRKAQSQFQRNNAHESDDSGLSALSESTVRGEFAQTPPSTQTDGYSTSLDRPENSLEHAVVRTRIEHRGGPSIAVYLKDVQSCKHLFDILNRKWTFMLGGTRITYCIVGFEWLEKDKSIIMQPNDEDGFRLMVEEACRSRFSPVGDKDTIYVDLYTD